MFENYNHLGSFNPFYVEKDKKKIFSPDFEGAAKTVNNRFEIDYLSIIEVLNKYYMFGDRTIFKRVKRSPWMAKFDHNESEWVYETLPQHDVNKLGSTEKAANQLFELLCNEVQSYISDKIKIGILLSGGMDSRVVAGILKHLIDQKVTSVTEVTVFTWGNKNSRDVVYSKKIADLFGWKWKHYFVGPEQLWENIKIAGKRGCEYTGLHLHAIPQIANDTNIDVMLAGSYGDSVGRAEYSGRHVTKLRPIHERMNNTAYLMKSYHYKQIKGKWEDDLRSYYDLFTKEKTYQQRELERQAHYMRRMLNPCMELINEKVTMHQVFTDPAVFGFMWGLDPKFRNDHIYIHLLNKMHPELSNIPWARTGLKYPEKSGNPDKYDKKHHSYSKYIQDTLFDRIQERLLNHKLLSDSIINIHSVKSLLDLVRKKQNQNFDYLERLCWLISFTFLLDKYNIDLSSCQEATLIDKINGKILLPIEYRVKHAIRKMEKVFKNYSLWEKN